MTRRAPLDDRDQQDADAILDIYLDGECYPFAAALCQLTCFEMVALATSEHPLRHVAVRDTDGRLYDARGLVSEKDFGGPFGVLPPYQLNAVTVEDLRRVRPVSEPDIARALRIIEAMWPQLVRCPSEEAQQTEAFLEGLEALSKKYGRYVRGAFPGTPAQIYPLEGDDVRYAYKTNAFGTGQVLLATTECKKGES